MKTLIILLVSISLSVVIMAQDSLKSAVKSADSSRKFHERLTEVTVRGRVSLLTLAPDKTVVDVKAMGASITSNTLEFLEKIPGITVNASGEISLNGRSGVLVLIDGRSTYMSAQDLAAYLKSIPAAILDKIELIDNPSSKYDAAGNAIINIRLKKNRDAGLTGNITGGFSQGKYLRSNNSVNINYSMKKASIYANVGYGTWNDYTIDNFDRIYYDDIGNTASLLKLANNNTGHGKSINIYTGADYYLSKKTTIGLIAGFNHGNRNGDFNFKSTSSDAAAQTTAFSSGYTLSRDERENYNFNLNFSHQFNQDGNELTADVNYLQYHSSSTRNQQNQVFDKFEQLEENDLFRYFIPVSSNIIVLKSDYVKPLSKTLKLEAGVKSSFIDNDNISDYFDINNNSPVFVPANSDHFKYRENINAAYFNLQQSGKRLQLQAGLRAENLHATGVQPGNESVQPFRFVKNNTELFPSLFFLYKLDTLNKNSINIIAVRRINRPNYFQLNPFMFQQDQYTYTAGNPDLNPQFQYRLELKFQHKNSMWFGLSYNKFTQLIFNSTMTEGDRYINRPENISKGFMLLLNSGFTYNPTKWWNLNYVLRLSRMGIRSTLYDEPLVPTTYVVRFEAYNYFPIGKSWSAEFGGYYASRDLNGQAFTKQMVRMNIGVQKKMWKDRASLRLGFEDILHSWKYRNYSIGVKRSSFYQTAEADTRRFTLGFSYRFGKDNNTKKRRSINANDEEKGRLE